MSKSQYHSCASYCDAGRCDELSCEINSSSEHQDSSAPSPSKAKQLKEINQSSESVSDRLKSSISVIGMNSKGLELASKLASQNYGVIAVDKMREVVASILTSSVDDLPSPFRKSLVENRNAKRLSATEDMVTAVKCSDTTFIISNETHDNSFSMGERYTDIQIASSLGTALKTKTHYHLIVFYDFDNFSTVKDGLIRIIENVSGKKCGEDFGVCAVIEYECTASSYLTAYIKGFDQSSELVVRRLFKPIASVNTYFDY